MMAAKTSSADSVELLLKNNADPNLLSEKNDKQNALAFALKTGNEKVISLLSKVTMQGMKSCIRVLAESNMTIGKEVKIILKKLIQEGKKDLLLEEASTFGNGHMANFLLNEAKLRWTNASVTAITNTSPTAILASLFKMDTKIAWTKSKIKEALRNSILSDNVHCCNIVKEYCEKIGIDTKNKELESLIIKRGRSKIVELFNFENMEIISPKYIEILDKFPKTNEFQYVNIMDKIISMVHEADQANRRLVKFENLLDKLQTPPIHPSNETKCPEDCSQTLVCRQIRDTVSVLDKVVQEIAKDFPILKNTVPIIVGSLKEGANIGDIDETDILLIIEEKKSEDLKKLIIFDKTDQKLKVRKFYWENEDGVRVA